MREPARWHVTGLLGGSGIASVELHDFMSIAMNFGIAAHNAGDRKTVGRWLALEFSTQARMPPTAFLRHEA
jgi:hypothetical protein